MAQNGRRSFYGKVLLEGRINLLTGLHIGGSQEAMQIGGVDLPVIKDVESSLPFIPGSSLKGKMRSTLEKFGTRINQDRSEKLASNRNIGTGRNPVWIHCCEDSQYALGCEVCRVFGSSADDRGFSRGRKAENYPARLMVRDSLLNQSLVQVTRVLTDVKVETGVDRATMAANPRRVERVLPGTIFSFEMVYSVEELEHAGKSSGFPKANVEMDLKNILTCMEMIQQEALGGYGSRGYGKVQFTFTRFIGRSLAYYQGSANKEKGLSDPEGFTVPVARSGINDIVTFLGEECGHAVSG